MNDIKRIDIKEFRRLGFLQEANRQFFHPHGLALEITETAICKNCSGDREDYLAWQWNTENLGLSSPMPCCPHCSDTDVPDLDARLSSVWDYRDDPEGVFFGNNIQVKRQKYENVKAERNKHKRARHELFGPETDIEPIEWEYEE